MSDDITSDQERAVLQAVRDGDHQRFEKLVLAYQNRLFGTMLGLLGNRQDAEDVTQEAFVTAFRKLHAFEERSSFFTWLHRIAYNLAIDFRRKPHTRHRQGQVSIDQRDDCMVTGETAPSVLAEQHERSELIQQALLKLDESRRVVLVLRDLQDLDYEQIASILEIPIGTVRSRIHRARLDLKEIIKQHYMELIDDYSNEDSVAQSGKEGVT